MYEVTETSTPSEISSAIAKGIFAPEPSTSRELAVSGDSDIPEAPGESDIPESSAPSETPLTDLATAPAVTLKPLPKSWKKEMGPVWEKADPAVHDYVYQREEAIMRGLQQYQGGNERWNEVIQPFKHVMDQHPDVNPVELLQNLMTNHLQVLSSPKERQISLIRDIVRGYGLDLQDFLPQNGEIPAALPPEVGHLQQELRQIQNHLTRQQRATYEAGVAEQTKVVTAFFSAPENKYAAEVEADILQLLQTGAADSLPSAYELACYRNPAVRVKLLADQRAAAAGEKPAMTNIDPSGEVRTRRSKPKSWQETADAVIQKHYGSQS